MSTKVKDNSRKVQDQLEANISRALTALGLKGVELTVEQMQHGYERRIWKTGDLQRDVSADPQPENHKVIIGNRLDYAIYVHDGTRKMAGRPYLQDALLSDEGQKALRKVAEAYLKEGFTLSSSGVNRNYNP